MTVAAALEHARSCNYVSHIAMSRSGGGNYVPDVFGSLDNDEIWGRVRHGYFY